MMPRNLSSSRTAIGAAFFFAAGLFAGTAQALDTFAGGPVYSQLQQKVGCELFNTGTTAVTLKSVNIYNASGQIQAFSSNTCGTTLAAKRGCFVQSLANNLSAFSCVIMVSPSKANLLGSVQSRNSSNVTISEAPMR